MPELADLSIKIFADGADLGAIGALVAKPWIRGITTNPTLMRKAGVTDYRAFAGEVLRLVDDRPVSFEVLADDARTMEQQARAIAGWGRNVNVKIPVTNSAGVFMGDLIERLSRDGVVVNVTAITTLDQVRAVAERLSPRTPAIVSVFAGRIADTGVDPVPLMAESLRILADRPQAELLWASPRELLNIVQANDIGCHIITVTNDLLAKLPLLGKDLVGYSLETVQMFLRDAVAAGFDVAVEEPVAG